MATAIDPQPLVEEAQCLFCKIPPGMVWYTVLAVIDAINNGDPVPTDPDELMDAARCLQCTIPDGYVPYAILASLTELGGGGLGGAQEVYEGRAPAAPDDPTKPALNYPTGGGTLTQWDGAAWV